MSQRHNGPPKMFDLGLIETTKVIQNRVVTGKAAHSKQGMQSTVSPELIGMGETLGSGNNAQHEAHQDLARLVMIGTFWLVRPSLLELFG